MSKLGKRLIKSAKEARGEADPKTPAKPSARDPIAEALANNPRFIEAPKTGAGFMIGGVKPQR